MWSVDAVVVDHVAPVGIQLRRQRILNFRPQLAILVEPGELVSPSSHASLAHFKAVAAAHGMDTTLILPGSYGALQNFDALFIRQTTVPYGRAHRYAIKARSLGIPVLDDPVTIMRGCDKILQCKLLGAAGVRAPRSAVISSRDEISEAVAMLGLPLVLKTPDGCFCRGVVKATTLAEAESLGDWMLQQSREILAQEYLPTGFDWRVCILGGEPIFACKYHMVSGHWQVVARGQRGSLQHGPVEPIALVDVPPDVLRSAVQAARCIGNGLYGVDLKALPSGPVVIEVNDNPDMDHGVETTANPEAWSRLAEWFLEAVKLAGLNPFRATG